MKHILIILKRKIRLECLRVFSLPQTVVQSVNLSAMSVSAVNLVYWPLQCSDATQSL